MKAFIKIKPFQNKSSNEVYSSIEIHFDEELTKAIIEKLNWGGFRIRNGKIEPKKLEGKPREEKINFYWSINKKRLCIALKLYTEGANYGYFRETPNLHKEDIYSMVSFAIPHYIGKLYKAPATKIQFNDSPHFIDDYLFLEFPKPLTGELYD